MLSLFINNNKNKRKFNQLWIRTKTDITNFWASINICFCFFIRTFGKTHKKCNRNDLNENIRRKMSIRRRIETQEVTLTWSRLLATARICCSTVWSLTSSSVRWIDWMRARSAVCGSTSDNDYSRKRNILIRCDDEKNEMKIYFDYVNCTIK